ncbi:MAG: carbohydrate kinase, partial [Ktedonobacteraceae bacterium]|nr:carbohydrate kinase [Ktedonobacteraceae bacterium]
MYLVGVDVGTTNTKAVLFDVDTGRVRAIGSSRTITRHPRMDWSEFDADELWQTVRESIRAVIQQCDQPERIRAISVASMGESGFPLDAQGSILYPAIAWHDQRTTTEAQWWEETLGAERVFEITGQLPLPIFGVNKLLWLRSNIPQIFERIRRWLSIEDFVLWKLGGYFATDYSIASRTMLFDQHTLDWSPSLLQHCDLPADWFPAALPSGTSLGPIRKEIAAETGLPEHTLICTGGHDHLCGALAAGVTHSGQLLESMGTASVLLALSDTFQPSSELSAAGCMSYAFVIPHTYVTIGMLNFAGGALEWIVKLLYGQGGDVSDAVYAQALR